MGTRTGTKIGLDKAIGRCLGQQDVMAQEIPQCNPGDDQGKGSEFQHRRCRRNDLQRLFQDLVLGHPEAELALAPASQPWEEERGCNPLNAHWTLTLGWFSDLDWT